MDTSYLQFLAGAMVISLTGVMAPGPLAAVTVGKGSKAPHAGALVAVGHAVVEFPLMIDRKSTRLNSSHHTTTFRSRMPSSA
jgi:hypothetical protein